MEGILALGPAAVGGRSWAAQLGPQVRKGHRLEVGDLLPQAHHLALNEACIYYSQEILID